MGTIHAEMRRRALEGLAKADGEGAVELLLAAALRGAQALPAGDRHGRLAEALADVLCECAAPRVAAVRALGLLRATAAVEGLCEMFATLPDGAPDDLGPEVAWALGEIGDRRAVPALAAVLDRRDAGPAASFFIHREALYALAELGDLAPIERYAEDESRHAVLRREAVEFILPRARARAEADSASSDAARHHG